MSHDEDMWPDNLLDSIPNSPRDILSQQAALLGAKTKNVVIAEVVTRVDEEGDFILKFIMRVPSLANYRFDLFGIFHGIDLYPVKEMGSGRTIGDEEHLKVYLSEKLREPRTVKIIRALVSQARNSESDDVPF